jgi:Protein of unknown function (DUF1353)
MQAYTLNLAPVKGLWVTLAPFMATYNHQKHPRLFINIPQGFKTNLDSVPRIPIVYLWLKNRTFAAAAIHAWMYANPDRFPRRMADDYFLLLMKNEGVRKRYRYPIYWAVRLFGSNYRK